MEEKYISTGKAAKLAKKACFAAIKRMVYAGKLKAEKNPVGRWRVRESEVNRLLGVKPSGEPRGA